MMLENGFSLKVLITFAMIVVAFGAFSDEITTRTNNCCTHLIADVRMSGDPSIAIRMDRLEDRILRLESKQPVCQGKQDGRLQKLEASLSRLNEVWDSRVDGKCEKNVGDLTKLADEFYENRYKELKAAHDRFMVYVNGLLVVLSIGVAIICCLVSWYGVWKPRQTDKRINKEWEQEKERISRLQQQSKDDAAEFNRSKAELYFELGRSSFIQYKAARDVAVLELVVKYLSHAVQYNVCAKSANGLKTTIALLNVVMNKKVEKDNVDGLPFELEDDRVIVRGNLKTWDWGVTEDDLEMVLAGSGLNEDQINWTVSNFRKIKTSCGGL